MIITKKALPRRTFLRGMGATMALPLLDAMVPAATALAQTVANPTLRLGFIYVPNGVIQDQWVPTATGRGFDFSPILSPLEPFREQVLVLSGLAHRQADSFGDGNGDHPRATAVWLSGVHAWERRGRQGPTDIKLGITADQIAARALGTQTPLPSLELVLETPTAIACDTGDCFYSNTISWLDETTPLDMEAHPRIVFERLFGDGGSAADRLAVMKRTGSILDSVTREVARLERTLDPRDRNKLDEYLTAVRDVEERIQRSESRDVESIIELPERPVDIPETFDEHAMLMFDLQTLAFQADITRVFTLMMAREASPRTYPDIGVPDQHHTMSHHRNDPEYMAKKAKIDTYHIHLLARFLEKLRNTPDGDGNLLDHSMIVYGGGIGNGNLHEHTNLPCLVAGGGGGRLKGGRHLAYPEDTQMANLLLTVLDKAGVQAEQLGDSSGLLNTGTLADV
ncbi:MAG: DUF1552 domain-containing protein [Acidobacteria bacterium]|nr:DUF1552 domain-containing protein [Acidobacteriota bacterium]TDI26895.1 MAG: DUF1552 domain-containing protein [Acidobacteriota bacterium]